MNGKTLICVISSMAGRWEICFNSAGTFSSLGEIVEL